MSLFIESARSSSETPLQRLSVTEGLSSEIGEEKMNSCVHNSVVVSCVAELQKYADAGNAIFNYLMLTFPLDGTDTEFTVDSVFRSLSLSVSLASDRSIPKLDLVVNHLIQELFDDSELHSVPFTRLSMFIASQPRLMIRCVSLSS